ncbi:MAG TPA: DUF2752 domain-containing protein [Polyangiaceae bacterium]
MRSTRDPFQTGARKRALTAASLTGAAIALVWIGAPVCPTALFFGIPCPGCGLTRAGLALLSGDVSRALHFHPLSPLLIPLFVGAMLKAAVDYVRGPSVEQRERSFWMSRGGLTVASLLLALVLGVWALRFAGLFGGPVPVESLLTLRERLSR